MTVTVVASATSAGAGTTGTAAVSTSPVLPTGTAVGDRVFIGTTSVGQTSTPAGWTMLANQSLGTGTMGASVGPRYIAVYYRDYDGVWTMPTVTAASVASNSIVGASCTMRADPGETFTDPVAAWGSDQSVDTSLSVMPAFTLTIAPGILWAVVGSPAAVGAISAQSWTSTGGTIGTPIAASPAAVTTTTGNDASQFGRSAPVTAGGTGFITYSATIATARSSGAVFVNQSSTVTSGGTAASAAGSITLGGSSTAASTASASGAISLGGTATPQARATSAGAIALGGTATATAPVTVSGGINLGGTGVGAPPDSTAAGSITLGGTGAGQAAATTGGSVTLGGVPTALAAATSSGTIVLGGSATAAVPATVAGLITLSGLATLTALDYLTHIYGAAVLVNNAGTAVLAGGGTNTAVLAAEVLATAVATSTPGTAVLTPVTFGTAALTGDATSTATLTGTPGTAVIQLT